MRKLIVTEFISLDGVIEGPGGEPGYAHSGWVAPHFSDALGAYKEAEQLEAETLLLGRITYESFAGAWPERGGAMADKINAMDKVVVSSSIGTVDWEGASVLDGELLAGVGALKQGDGGPILVAGSRSVAQALLRAGLVDELHLQVFPVILGSGIRLYPESPDTIALTLATAETLDNGVQIQTWTVG